MCEIAIAGTDLVEDNLDGFVEGLCQTLYESNNDGFGIAAVYRTDEGTFDYEIVKAETPDWSLVEEWVEDHLDAWRFIVHARLATAGGTGFKQSHPLYVPDEECDAEWVIHNGVVHGSSYKRDNLQEDGRDFRTDVDSEVIPHYHEDLPEPDELDEYERANLRGRLNYLLLGEEQILIHNDGKYTITDDLRMTCRDNWTADDTEGIIDNGFAVFTPDGEVETNELGARRSSVYSSSGDGWAGYGNFSRSDDQDSTTRTVYGHRRGRGNGESDSGDDDPNVLAKASFKQNEHSIESRFGSGHGYRLSCASTTINNERMIAISVYDEDTGKPVKGAKITVFADSYDYEYSSAGVYDVNGIGERYVRMPDGGEKINVWLMDVVPPEPRDSDKEDDGDPLVDLEEEPDDTDDACDIDDPCSDRVDYGFGVELTPDEVQKVEWWHHYKQYVHGTQKKAGYCSMHNVEYNGDCCSECLQDFDRETLLDSMTDAKMEYMPDNDGEEVSQE